MRSFLRNWNTPHFLTFWNDKETDEKGKILNDSFLAALKTTREHYNKANYMESFKSCDAVRDATKPLLKYEWERVKNGEPAYKRAKKISAIVLVSGLVIAALDFGYVLYQSTSQNKVETEESQPVLPENKTPNKQLNPDAPKSGAPVS